MPNEKSNLRAWRVAPNDVLKSDSWCGCRKLPEGKANSPAILLHLACPGLFQSLRVFKVSTFVVLPSFFSVTLTTAVYLGTGASPSKLGAVITPWTQGTFLGCLNGATMLSNTGEPTKNVRAAWAEEFI